MCQAKNVAKKAAAELTTIQVRNFPSFTLHEVSCCFHARGAPWIIAEAGSYSNYF